MKKGKISKIFIISYLVLALTVSIFPSCFAGNISSSWGTDSKITVNTEGTRFNFRDITQNGVSILGNNQGDVDKDTDLTINVTNTENLDNIDHINISAFFDKGSDSNHYQDISGANNRFRLEYDNSTGEEDWGLVSDHPNNEVSFFTSAKNYQNSTTINWTVTLHWNHQIHHAVGDSGTPGISDTPYTWNVNWSIDSDNPTYPQIDKTNEFGVYKYVYLSTSGDVTGTGSPGTTISPTTDPGMETGVTFRSNDRFNLSVQINSTFDDGDLTTNDGEHNIPVSNISVSTTWGEGISDYTDLPGLGSPIILNTQKPHPAYESGNQQSFNTKWQVEIPFGQYPTTYDTQLAYKIDMEAGL